MHTKQLHSAAGDAISVMPKFSPAGKAARFNPIHDEFLAHPTQFPLRFRRRPTLPWHKPAGSKAGGDVGLSFIAEKYIPAGTRLDVEIPLRGHVQHFMGQVVMVREVDHGFEIGLWFASPGDATRARIVEQICHTECYLQDRHRVRN